MNWIIHLDGGPRRVNHAAVLMSDKIYSFGGYCSGEDYDIRRPMDVHILDTTTYRWSSVPTPTNREEQYFSVPYQRYGHTAVAYKQCAYIWGGRNDSDGACNQLFEFNTLTGTWRKVLTSGQVPPARDGHSACVIGAKMYIFGGFEEEFERFSNEVYELSFSTWQWKEIVPWGSAPNWRDFHTATAIGSRMYIFGGRSDAMGQFHSNREIYCERLKYLDTCSMSWHEPDVTGEIPCGRRSHSAFAYDGCLYIFGGYNGTERKHFNCMFKYDPSKSHWSRMHPRGCGPKPRRRQCCIVYASKMFLFGGTSPTGVGPAGMPQLNTGAQVEAWMDEPLTDHSDMYVLDFEPSLKTLCIQTCLQQHMEGEFWKLPCDLRWDIAAMTKPNRIASLADRGENSHG